MARRRLDPRVWGFLHGAWLVAHRVVQPWLPKAQAPDEQIAYAMLAGGCSMVVVWVTWVFFRAASTTQAFDICARMAGLAGSDASSPSIRSYVWLLTALTCAPVLLAGR